MSTIHEDESEEGAPHNEKPQEETVQNDIDDFIAPDLQHQLWEKAGKDEAAYQSLVATDIHAKRKRIEDGRQQLRDELPDLVARAKAIQRTFPPDFRDLKVINGNGQQQMTAPLASDLNIMDAFDVLFGNGNGRPYFDTFKGLNVGWNGHVIDDDFDLTPLVEAIHAFKIPLPTFERVEKLFKRYTRRVKINSLIERMKVMVPEWDRIPRMESLMIRLFQSFDTELNRQFGRYFWLSVYNRAMYPGCNAPMVLALFGTQGTGKSYFGKLICEEMVGSPEADSTPLDWTKDFNDFLRQITGQSVVANVAEMAGFTRAELTKIKAMTTRTMDIMNYKWERDVKQMRQWIMLMDGNEYAGLQRDETGNRRFYPMFVGQLPFDAQGQVQWREDFYIDYSDFRRDFWQVMAEAAQWMEKEGMAGYQRLVADTERKVKAFSAEEMRNDRGTIRDDDLDMYIPAAMAIVQPLFPKELREESANHAGRVTNKRGTILLFSEVRDAVIRAAGRNLRVVPSHLRPKLTAMGATIERYADQRAFVFESIKSQNDWDRYMISMYADIYTFYKKKYANGGDPEAF
jgi:hypothetical protein